MKTQIKLQKIRSICKKSDKFIEIYRNLQKSTKIAKITLQILKTTEFMKNFKINSSKPQISEKLASVKEENSKYNIE